MPYLCCEKCKVLGLRKVASQPHSHTISCVRISCSRTTSKIYLSLHPEWKISSSVYLLIHKSLFLLASNLSCKYRNMLPRSKKGDRYLLVALMQLYACYQCVLVCVWVQASINAHTSYIYRMFVHGQWLSFSTPMLNMWKRCGSYFETLRNLWKHKSTCLTSETKHETSSLNSFYLEVCILRMYVTLLMWDTVIQKYSKVYSELSEKY